MKIVNILFLATLLICQFQINAQPIDRDQKKEQLIEDQLKAINPELVRPFKEATIAMDKGNLALADSLYSLVYANAPGFDPLLRRLGGIRFQLGKKEEGKKLCEKAVEINNTAYNLLALANCLAQEGEFQVLTKASDLLNQARLLPNGDDISILALLGQINLTLNNPYQFQLLSKELSQKYPGMMVTHFYAAISAAYEEQWKLAKKEILIAKKMGLPDDAVKDFLDSGVNSHVHKRQLIEYSIGIVVLWAVGLLLLFIIGKMLSNLTLRYIEKQAATAEPGSDNKNLRKIYRFFINVGGAYYYFSLPIILVLVIAFVFGLFYLFFALGHYPVKLMLIIAVGSGLTIYGMVRSLLIKVDSSDPGRKLETEEAPDLFRLTNEVAAKIGTRPIDEIRITPSTDLAVYENGSWKAKMQDKAKRNLILGIGVLKDFNLGDFKAVLAHEYGHFSNRDTAGGNVAFRVRTDMNKYIYALYAAGQNVSWNIAFQFLRLYNFIFRRISHGSTRLQEVMADYMAAKTYGKLAFQNGLTHVIKREIEFNIVANAEIDSAQNDQRPFNNLYHLHGDFSAEMADTLDKALNSKTTEDDTHPSPADRFRYISNIAATDITGETGKVSDLFTNWDNITLEMTRLIEDRIKGNS